DRGIGAGHRRCVGPGAGGATRPDRRRGLALPRRCGPRATRGRSAPPRPAEPGDGCPSGRQSIAMTRHVDADPTVVPARPDLGGGAATPSRRLPGDAASGLPARPRPLRIGPATFDWGRRTYVMGILNVTPDSFSGDGLLATEGGGD